MRKVIAAYRYHTVTRIDNWIDGMMAEDKITPQSKKTPNKSNSKYTVASLFAGIGGICRGFEEANCEVVWANEIDKYACETYRKFRTEKVLVEGDVKLIKKIEPDFQILTAGFPCQPFSLAGYRKGFNDPRGKLFENIIGFLDYRPRAVFLENVGNLLTHDNGNTCRYVIDSLKSKNYHVVEPKVMNTKDYGNLPQIRNRIYFVAFKEKKDYDAFVYPCQVKLEKKIEDMVKWNNLQDEKYYYSEKNAKHFDTFESEMTDVGTIYQWRRVYVRANKNSLCPTLTANMGTGGHNVPIIRCGDNRIRKITPYECSALQGFPENFEFPDIADSHRYKQIGNSVSIPVVRRIAESMVKAMELNDS